MSEEEIIRNHYIFSTTHELDDDNKFLKKYILNLEYENKQLKQQLKDIEEYLESIKDMPDADMYIKLGEYKEFKHILDLIHRGSE